MKLLIELIPFGIGGQSSLLGDENLFELPQIGCVCARRGESRELRSGLARRICTPVGRRTNSVVSIPMRRYADHDSRALPQSKARFYDDVQD